MKGLLMYLSLPLVINGRVIVQTLRQDGSVDAKGAPQQLGTDQMALRRDRKLIVISREETNTRSRQFDAWSHVCHSPS
jgi:hypothetical protein